MVARLYTSIYAIFNHCAHPYLRLPQHDGMLNRRMVAHSGLGPGQHLIFALRNATFLFYTRPGRRYSAVPMLPDGWTCVVSTYSKKKKSSEH
jgi:hypothetical protein